MAFFADRTPARILISLAIMWALCTIGACSGPIAANAGTDALGDSAVEEVAQLDANKADSADIAAPQADVADATGADAVAPVDAAGADGAQKCPGAPGCSCKENGDCDNAQCIETGGNASGSGKVCATPCVDKCADGFKCTLINSGSGDSVTICVPKYMHLCDPCVKSKDCQSLGIGDAACVHEAGQGNFCGTACAIDGDCAAGYGCQSVNSVEGAPVKQCVKTSTAPELKYGECTCSELAVAQKAQTNCFIEHKNDKGELVGKCAGVRACGSSGLTTCAAPALDVEVCDGKDNDCDGLTDESTCDAGGTCNVGSCDPQQGCQYNKLNNVPCDADKNACTENDQCKQGSCVPGAGKICDDGNPCTTDACDPASGCTKTADDGKACDADGNACTSADHCVGSTCTAGKMVDCDNTNPCAKASCDNSSGKCVGKSAQDGVPCDDGTVCTQTDVCKSGECIGKIVSCDDNNPCTGNACDAVLGCKTTNLDGIACDDDNPCTIGDLCNAGACAKGAAKTCDAGVTCVVGACSLVNGKCDYKNKAAGAPCNDGDACTQNDGCNDAICQGKTVNCDDSNPCTDDSCDGKNGCTHLANAVPCSDGDACTQSDNCKDSLCVSGAAKVCADNVLCTADTCNKTTGACFFDAAAMNATPCDDGNVCTLGDACANGFCSGGLAKDCNDNNVCTDDLCDKIKGCNPTFNSKGCDDGNACTKSDICKFGDCEGSAVSCNDNNVCTDDACDAKKGCINTGNAAKCDDSNACTQNDACKNSVCGGPAVNCDDGNICSDDSCDKSAGCVQTPNVLLCPDNDTCTSNEVCKNLNCVKKVTVCDDGNPCTLDTCDGIKGCVPNNVVDKTDCGGLNWCMAGKCIVKQVCGNGSVEAPEQCDLGNKNGVPASGCSADCLLTALACGKGTPLGNGCVWSVAGTDTFTVPGATNSLTVTMIGGGAGGGTGFYYPGGGGGSGYYILQKAIAVQAGAQLTIEVGAGGLISTGGGASKFGTTVVNGGLPGQPHTAGSGQPSAKGGNGGSGGGAGYTNSPDGGGVGSAVPMGANAGVAGTPSPGSNQPAGTGGGFGAGGAGHWGTSGYDSNCGGTGGANGGNGVTVGGCGGGGGGAGGLVIPGFANPAASKNTTGVAGAVWVSL